MFVPRQLPPAGPFAKADVDNSEVRFVIGRLGLGVRKILRRCVLVVADLSHP